MTAKTEFRPYTLWEMTGDRAVTGVLKKGATTVAIFPRKRQVRRVKEILRILRAKGVDLDRLDALFFAILAAYLSEERDVNMALLEKEYRRLS